MKKLLLIILTVSAMFTSFNAGAQSCGFITPCNASSNIATGFPVPDSIPCIVQGQYYSYSIPFKMYNTFNYVGVHGIDSIAFDTLFNLPCGICYSLSKASGIYAADSIGCVTINGTTNDAVGQYNLRFEIGAYLSGNGGAMTGPEGPSTVDAAGIKLWLRVKSAGGACVSVDTSSGATDQVATLGCPVGINEVTANVTTLTIVPNPMNSSAVVSFDAEKNAGYTLRITDITGQIVSVKEIQAVAGANTTVIEKGKLSSGIYFLSLTDGVSSVTKKFTIMD